MNGTMLNRRTLLAAVFAVILAVIGNPGAGQAESFEEGATRFIRSLADKAVASLTDESIGQEERAAKFRRLLNEHFAVETMGRWVLGRYWKKATEEEQQEYLELFEDLIVANYVERFKRYAGVALRVTKAVIADRKDAIVYSRISRPDSSEYIKVNWRVRLRDGKYKVIDVMVEGISMGQTQRSEFSSVIRKNGGRVEGLLVELRKRLNGNA